ncbi:hypothetical protein BO94DRAFT_530657 [Aspergillus sclerotioniger CBS 115572]|uniref:Uncharacterized protein n=1 Tax=Aspergillus sclerotioniger CBS 115572 TaxID=1450535 RepID=A0A317XBH4_9EURO|nr:hypothetical protein BO94DRAFT_530657 [Aspergillus sclerotioniger CBS 115572]PWY95916.1 hypothetical protein BO94DRAFT_530657 [Aspergillus sclerotioniger CBS 115572]
MVDLQQVADYSEELNIDTTLLYSYIERHGDRDIDSLRELSPEERASSRVLSLIFEQEQLQPYLRWRADRQDRIQVDYSNYTIPDSFGAESVSGNEDAAATEDCEVIMPGYNAGFSLHRDKAIFIPALREEMASVFESRGSGWTVLSLGVVAHDTTLYLLLPTALVHDYRARVEDRINGDWVDTDVADPTFDDQIEGLKRWAPERTRFVGRRVDVHGDAGSHVCDRVKEVLVAAVVDSSLPPPITCTIVEAGHEVLQVLDTHMKRLTDWWRPSKDMSKEQTLGMANYDTMEEYETPNYHDEVHCKSPEEGTYNAPSEQREVYVKYRVRGGYMLSNGKFARDNAWGYNPYTSSFLSIRKIFGIN